MSQSILQSWKHTWMNDSIPRTFYNRFNPKFMEMSYISIILHWVASSLVSCTANFPVPWSKWSGDQLHGQVYSTSGWDDGWIYFSGEFQGCNQAPIFRNWALYRWARAKHSFQKCVSQGVFLKVSRVGDVCVCGTHTCAVNQTPSAATTLRQTLNFWTKCKTQLAQKRKWEEGLKFLNDLNFLTNLNLLRVESMDIKQGGKVSLHSGGIMNISSLEEETIVL